MTDPDSNPTNYTYDADGRLTVTTFADGTTSTNEYKDLTGNITATIDESGNRNEYDYDPMSRLIAKRTFMGAARFTRGAPATTPKAIASGRLTATARSRRTRTIPSIESSP